VAEIVLAGLLAVLVLLLILGALHRRGRAATDASPRAASAGAATTELAADLMAGRIAEAMSQAREEVLAQARSDAAEILGRAEREASESIARAERERAQLFTERADLQRDRDSLAARMREADTTIGRARSHAEAMQAQARDELAAVQDRAEGERSADREAARIQAEELQATAQRELARIAGLSHEEARTALIAEIERDARRQAHVLVRQIEAEATEQADERAREIVGLAVARVASGTTTESVVQAIHLPSEDYKGRIIGREGRNIRAFEQVTGVNVLIDDTPDAVLLSCFDPVRREIGRLTLEALLADGRVHPQRIEEQHVLATAQVDGLMRRAARDALSDARIEEVDPEIERLLGRLRYRTSYGQNVLAHLVETAHIASGIAHELHLPQRSIEVVKRAAFLHDLGKAVTHEVEGSHALIGADLARRHGEEADVVHAIEAHHQEIAPRTLEAWLTIASDSCSGGRPGARRESLEAYVERLGRIEDIAREHPGVDRVYAMSAGRELRVLVLPDQVSDDDAALLARDIARQVEDELTYPGQIRVTVIRESRATETAH
jgi:ribonuclease Y